MAALIAARLYLHGVRHGVIARRALSGQMSANFVYFILPGILLLLGLPIFVVLLLTSMAAMLFVAHVPMQAVQTYMFGSLDNFPLLAVPLLVWRASQPTLI